MALKMHLLTYSVPYVVVTYHPKITVRIRTYTNLKILCQELLYPKLTLIHETVPDLEVEGMSARWCSCGIKYTYL